MDIALYYIGEKRVMIQSVKVERFKTIQSATLELGKINVLVGANNAGKTAAFCRLFNLPHQLLNRQNSLLKI